MKCLLRLLLLATALPAAAQPKYADSLKIYRDNYKKELAEIIKSDTAYVRFFEPDKSFRVVARVELLNAQSFFTLRTSGSVTKQARKFARVTFTIKGKEHQLYAYQLQSLLTMADFKEDFFIPFLDAGSGEASYTGGRYLDFKTGDIVNGQLTIDFNKAYNPYCAFTTGYNCPIPPAENTLDIVIAAGEKKFGKTH